MRRLGFTSAAALVVANMIGTGVFTTSGFALAELGSRELVLIAWVVGGLIATMGALSYGALARRIPRSGGEFTFLTETVHPVAGFVAGWVSLLAGFTAPIAAAALAFEAYFAAGTGVDAPPGVIGAAAIVAAGLAHGLRFRVGTTLQDGLVALMLLLIVGFIGFGVVSLPDLLAEPARASGGALDFAMSVTWISFSYSGWNAAVYVGGAVRDPDKTLPRSLIFATGLVTVLYLLLNAVFLYGAPYEVLAGRPDVAAGAAASLGGPTLGRVLSVLVAIALLTSVSSMIMAGPRVITKMAEDGLLPATFSRFDDAPGAAVLVQVVLSILVVTFADLAQLLGFLGYTLGLCAAATVVGLLRLRRKEGADKVPIPGYPFVPGLFVLATLVMTVLVTIREPGVAGIGLLLAASGVPLYYWRRKR